MKLEDSKVKAENLTYEIDNSYKNKKLANMLYDEQKGFCAYTDEYISRTDAFDVEHFNPTLKGTGEDSYENWFIVKHLWNKEKSTKWAEFQPVLSPTAEDLEDRIIYMDGDYVAASTDDTEANNLVRLLKLDDPILSINRKKYIKRRTEEMTALQQEPQQFFEQLWQAYPPGVSYLRAIKEEFNVDMWEVIEYPIV